MVIGLLLYVLTFALLSMAQFLKKNIFQKLILPVFFSTSKLKLLLFLCLRFIVSNFSFNFSLSVSVKLKYLPISNVILVRDQFVSANVAAGNKSFVNLLLFVCPFQCTDSFSQKANDTLCHRSSNTVSLVQRIITIFEKL